MKTFTSILSTFGLVALASAKDFRAVHAYPNTTDTAAAATYGNSGPATTVTDYSVVETLTTYCPEPTLLTYGTKTYTVTKPTTLTITGK